MPINLTGDHQRGCNVVATGNCRIAVVIQRVGKAWLGLAHLILIRTSGGVIILGGRRGVIFSIVAGGRAGIPLRGITTGTLLYRNAVLIVIGTAHGAVGTGVEGVALGIALAKHLGCCRGICIKPSIRILAGCGGTGTVGADSLLQLQTHACVNITANAGDASGSADADTRRGIHVGCNGGTVIPII